MKPSNPATFFISGSDEESFTYAPGPTAFYAVARGKSHIPFSLMLFAWDQADVIRILKDLCTFAETCLAKRKADRVASGDTDKHGMDSSRQRSIQTMRTALRGRGEYHLEIGPAAMNQIYKVGWAGNDTLF